jgi:serine protease AprX
VKETLPNVNAVLADVPTGKLLNLASSDTVRGLSLDASLQPVDGNVVQPPAAPARGSDTLRDVLGLPLMNPAATGVGVAVIDSGLSSAADFAPRITAFYDFTAGGIAAAPIDPYGHGTHVAGIIASSGADSSRTQYRGVAADARLIGLRVLDDQGVGQTSFVLQAIDFAIANREALGIDVINLSLGHPIYEPADTDPLVGAVEAAVRAGMVVVVSGGNFGYNRVSGQSGYAGITSPGNAPSAITVGALQTANTTTRDDDQVAPYSSRGPSWYDATAKPDLVAPGVGIISNATMDSTLYQLYPSVRVDASHLSLNGTSMAAAVTSGVAALVIEANRQAHPNAPSLTPNAIKAILQFSATPVGFATGAPSDALTEGAGAINVPAAIDLARAIDPTQPIGTDWLLRAIAPSTTYARAALPWAQSITWRDTRLSGSVLDQNRVAWGLAVPWGTDTAWTADVTPETDIVWGSAISWNATIVWGPDLLTSGSTLDPSTTFWGSLATVNTNGQTFTWGSTDPPTASRP